MEEMYEKHVGIIRNRCLELSKMTGRDYKDLFSEGNIIFMRVYPKWDKNKSKFCTFLYRSLTLGLWKYIYKNDLPIDSSHIENNYLTDATRQELKLKETIEEMSSEAKTIINILLTTPTEILDITGIESARCIRGKIRDHLRLQGWNWNTIWNTFKELKLIFN